MLYKALEKKIPPINPNPVPQAPRTVGCPTLWLWTPTFRKIHLITELVKAEWNWHPGLCCLLPQDSAASWVASSCQDAGSAHVCSGCRRVRGLELSRLGCGRISCDTVLEVGGGGSRHLSVQRDMEVCTRVGGGGDWGTALLCSRSRSWGVCRLKCSLSSLMRGLRGDSVGPGGGTHSWGVLTPYNRQLLVCLCSGVSMLGFLSRKTCGQKPRGPVV